MDPSILPYNRSPLSWVKNSSRPKMYLQPSPLQVWRIKKITSMATNRDTFLSLPSRTDCFYHLQIGHLIYEPLCFILPYFFTLLKRTLARVRGAGSILRRRRQLPEKGTFSMTNIRIITKKASLTFPILLLRLLLGGGGGVP